MHMGDRVESPCWLMYAMVNGHVTPANPPRVNGNAGFPGTSHREYHVVTHLPRESVTSLMRMFALAQLGLGRLGGNFFYRKSTIAAIEENNNTYCVQKRIETVADPGFP